MDFSTRTFRSHRSAADSHAQYLRGTDLQDQYSEGTGLLTSAPVEIDGTF